MIKKIILGICIAAIATTLSAQDLPPTLYELRLEAVPLDVALQRLQELTGKDITVDLGVNALVSLDTLEKVTADEAATIIIQALQKEGLDVENLDENTLRVRDSSTYEAIPPGWIEETMKRQEKFGEKPRPPTYSERRQQRIQNIRESADSSPPIYSDEELEKHLQAYQMEVIREGLTPLPVPLTPEEIKKLNNEGVTVPADTMPEEPPMPAGDNQME